MVQNALNMFELKGALDKYNIYFFIFNSTEDFYMKPIPKFSADSANAFSFMTQNEVFCKQHHLQSVP